MANPTTTKLGKTNPGTEGLDGADLLSLISYPANSTITAGRLDKSNALAYRRMATEQRLQTGIGCSMSS
jgi:hypothetical protein